MGPVRDLHTLEDRPSGFFDAGHFWIREYVPGGVFTARMDESGLLSFTASGGVVDPAQAWPFRRAVVAVRDDFDRDAFRTAVSDVSAYEFSLLAPLGMDEEFDWDRIPAVYGLDIWDGEEGAFASIDVAERVFEGIGLDTIPTIEREVPARDIDPSTYPIPESKVGDGRAVGIVFAKKRGERVVKRRDGSTNRSRDPPSPAGNPSDMDTWVTETVTEALLGTLFPESDQPVSDYPLETLETTVAGEVARRYFRSVGKPAMEKPDVFGQAIHDRLVTVRNEFRP